ncbi:unnamed protein product [Symbiodinium sp. CCMP2592]|nr:unnamed protein product [Symbiodinium sp. CCMP2592]
MSTGRDPTELVDLLRALGNLTINVNVTNAPGTSTSSSASIGTEAAPAASSAARDSVPRSRPLVYGPWEPRATPVTCPTSVTSLARQLRGTVNGQNPLQRIETAYALGREAQLIYSGEERYFTARPRARKVCYVVLCGRNVDEPFYTTSAFLYSQAEISSQLRFPTALAALPRPRLFVVAQACTACPPGVTDGC